MNFTQLENLDAVLEYGGVRRAAAHLGVTPQAVSSSIRKLERELGCALFALSSLLSSVFDVQAVLLIALVMMPVLYVPALWRIVSHCE